MGTYEESNGGHIRTQAAHESACCEPCGGVCRSYGDTAISCKKRNIVSWNIREYEPDSVRHRFTIVLQDYNNNAFTVKESVSLSDVSQTDDNERVLSALKRSVRFYRLVFPET